MIKKYGATRSPPKALANRHAVPKINALKISPQKSAGRLQQKKCINQVNKELTIISQSSTHSLPKVKTDESSLSKDLHKRVEDFLTKYQKPTVKWNEKEAFADYLVEAKEDGKNGIVRKLQGCVKEKYAKGEESPHEIEVRVLCDRIHKLETVLENKNEELMSINKRIAQVVTANDKLEKDIEELRSIQAGG